MKNFIPIVVVVLTSAVSPVLFALESGQQANHAKLSAPVKNIIMVIADGMGPAYTSAYRYYRDDPKTPDIEKTVFDRHLIGSASTYPAPISGYITDSAAAATSMASGIKTYNGAIGVDVNKQPVQSVLSWARSQGKKTGVVVTSQINHATPAAYLTHNESRKNYNEIADSYLDNSVKSDVFLGGGWQYFIRKDRNLVNDFKAKSFHYLDTYEQLSSIPKGKRVLGLFDKKGLPWALDDINRHRLTLMTQAALPQLENDKGYFLLIEASQIDWAGHGRDIASAMAEIDDLAHTLRFLEAYVAKHPNTLVVVTADHSTGGLSIGNKTAASDKNIKSNYLWQPEILRTMKHSAEYIAKQLSNSALSSTLANDLFNFELNHAELATLNAAKAGSSEQIAEYMRFSKAQKKGKWPPQKHSLLLVEVKKIIDQRTNTGWGTTSGSASHTGVDVPVFAFGSHQHEFSGAIDNTDIAKKIFTLLGKQN